MRSLSSVAADERLVRQRTVVLEAIGDCFPGLDAYSCGLEAIFGHRHFDDAAPVRMCGLIGTAAGRADEHHREAAHERPSVHNGLIGSVSVR